MCFARCVLILCAGLFGGLDLPCKDGRFACANDLISSLCPLLQRLIMFVAKPDYQLPTPPTPW